jgi:hypothetical protein
MNEIVRLPTARPCPQIAPSVDGAAVTMQSREVIRLWNRMRAQERALQAVRTASAQAELFAMRRQLQQALATRDRLIAAARSPAGRAE